MREGGKSSETLAKSKIDEDSVSSEIDPQATGNEQLPAPRRIYRAAIRHAADTFPLLRQGGLTPRNWIRLDGSSGNLMQPEDLHPTGSDSAVADPPPPLMIDPYGVGRTERVNSRRREITAR